MMNSNKNTFEKIENFEFLIEKKENEKNVDNFENFENILKEN